MSRNIRVVGRISRLCSNRSVLARLFDNTTMKVNLARSPDDFHIAVLLMHQRSICQQGVLYCTNIDKNILVVHIIMLKLSISFTATATRNS